MTRTRICFYILLLAPLLIYWQTIFSDFGFRDDYAHLREAREEPSKLVKFTASHGRPLYGALLETSFANLGEVENLVIPRTICVGILTLLALALWRQLYHSGWTEIEAAVVGLGVVLLPGAQILVTWAICWPHALAMLLAVAGFVAVEAELERGGLKRTIALLGGIVIYALAALIYQSNALFAVVPMAAVLLVRSNREPSSDLRWGLTHFLALFGGLIAAYVLSKSLFAYGIFSQSSRMQLEEHPFTKLIWFFSQSVPNALALYALADDYNTGAAWFYGSAALVLAVIIWGARAEIKRLGKNAKWRVLLCLLVLPFLAHLVSLAAAERSTGYRVLLALSGLTVVLLVHGWRSLRAADRIRPIVYKAGLLVLISTAAVSAHFNSYNLMAVPQSYEWDIIHKAVMRASFAKSVRAYIITPTPEDRATIRVFSDEFGSLSSDSDWAPREMFNAAVHGRFPIGLPKGSSYEVTLGREEPAAGQFDLVIDMRKLKDFGER